KERVEVFAGGVSAVIDDFRSAEVHGAKRERWKGRQDKGHRAELEAFLRAVREGATSPIPLAELENSSRATLRAARSLATGLPERLDGAGVATRWPRRARSVSSCTATPSPLTTATSPSTGWC